MEIKTSQRSDRTKKVKESGVQSTPGNIRDQTNAYENYIDFEFKEAPSRFAPPSNQNSDLSYGDQNAIIWPSKKRNRAMCSSVIVDRETNEKGDTEVETATMRKTF